MSKSRDSQGDGADIFLQSGAAPIRVKQDADRDRRGSLARGGHPFDVEYVRLPPGAANFPFHAHFAQWEMYIFLQGRGSVRGPETTVAIEVGQSIIFSPGERAKILNTGQNELSYFVVADHSPADVVIYPDTGKWGIKPQRKCFTLTETSYYEPMD